MGIVTEGRVHRLGESWETGTIVLSWDSVEQGAHDIRDGHNVTFHEFAHQLDHEDGPTDGAPGLGSRAAYRSWARVFSENYSDFLELTERGRKTVLDAYGATNPAEFFAVTTETFFEKPVQLSEDRPDLYQELMAYYKVDPREWYE
jgi:Mlc titration factor MtfA (ptsG expression regulator)